MFQLNILNKFTFEKQQLPQVDGDGVPNLRLEQQHKGRELDLVPHKLHMHVHVLGRAHGGHNIHVIELRQHPPFH